MIAFSGRGWLRRRPSRPAERDQTGVEVHVITSRGRGWLRRPPAGPAEGDHADVVAVPGLGLSVAVARRALDRLPGVSRTVVLVPGFGRRVPRGTPVSPDRLARLLLDALPSRAPVVLVGHSASCQLVAEAAVRAPDRVAGLVLVGPTTDPRASSWPGLVSRWLRTAAHEHPGQVPLLVHTYARTGLVSMARGMGAARHHRLDRVLGDVTCPVLVVRGRHDRICPADWATALAASARSGIAATLPAGAHMVPITHPQLLADRIATFLDERVQRMRPSM